FTVDLDGAIAFLPLSQVDILPIRDVTPLMHNLAFFEVLNDFRTLLGTGFFQNRKARNHDVAAALVHLEDFEGLRVVH
ncbi:hypothetical protein ACC690_39565, partial [Rhizobium johnstonii]|uniref:hypothetical protein n=1 Tax=Rhizobium johnstonii TaxID=3019933 RepID=UPI003F966328